MANYVVEKILGSRLVEGKKQYKIKWKNYPISQCTWEPVEHLSNCIGMVKDFEKKRKEQTLKSVPKPSKPAPSRPQTARKPSVPQEEDEEEEVEDEREVEEEQSEDERVYEEEDMEEEPQPPKKIRPSGGPLQRSQRHTHGSNATKITANENADDTAEEGEQGTVFGMKIGEGKSKVKILGVFRDQAKNMYFRVAGKSDPVPRSELIESDPMALVLYYEKNVKLAVHAK